MDHAVCREHEKHAPIRQVLRNLGKLRSKYDCREKRLTLASMVDTTTAKPAGRPREMLEMLLDKTLHTPGQSVALAFAGAGERL